MCRGSLASYSRASRPARDLVVHFRRLENVIDCVGIVVLIIVFPRLSRSRRNFYRFDRFPAFVSVWQRFDVTRIESAVSPFNAGARWLDSSTHG